AEADAKPILDQLVTDGLASYRDGKLSGFSLTKPGRAEHAHLLSAGLDGADRPPRPRPRRRVLPGVPPPEHAAADGVHGVAAARRRRRVDGERPHRTPPPPRGRPQHGGPPPPARP